MEIYNLDRGCISAAENPKKLMFTVTPLLGEEN